MLQKNGFAVGTHEEMIPKADLVANLTPDKQHSNVVDTVMPLMKKGASPALFPRFLTLWKKEKRSGTTLLLLWLPPSLPVPRSGKSTNAVLEFQPLLPFTPRTTPTVTAKRSQRLTQPEPADTARVFCGRPLLPRLNRTLWASRLFSAVLLQTGSNSYF